jgi:hypothetical protein
MVKAWWSLARAMGAVPQVATQWGCGDWAARRRVEARRRVGRVRRTVGLLGGFLSVTSIDLLKRGSRK